MDPRARILVTATLLAAACASSRPDAAARAPRAAGVLPRSSVAAILARRGELDLDDEQVRRLEAIDEAFQKELAQPSASAATAAGGPAPPRRPSAGGSGVAPPGSPMPGMARPGRPQDAPAGDRMGRPRGGRDAAERRDAPARGRSWEDEDTASYLRAEEILRPEQRERARAVAERYREEIYEQRAAERRPGGR